MLESCLALSFAVAALPAPAGTRRATLVPVAAAQTQLADGSAISEVGHHPPASKWAIMDGRVDVARSVDLMAKIDSCVFKRGSVDTIFPAVGVVGVVTTDDADYAQFKRIGQFSGNDSPVYTGQDTPSESDVSNLLNSTRCTIENATHTILVSRFGPLEFTPNVAYTIRFNATVPLRSGTSTYLIGAAAQMVDPMQSFRPLPHPPVHAHHSTSWHIGDQVPPEWSESDEVKITTTNGLSDPFNQEHSATIFPGDVADNWCPEPQPAGACMYSWMPAGYGKPVGPECAPLRSRPHACRRLHARRSRVNVRTMHSGARAGVTRSMVASSTTTGRTTPRVSFSAATLQSWHFLSIRRSTSTAHLLRREHHSTALPTQWPARCLPLPPHVSRAHAHACLIDRFRCRSVVQFGRRDAAVFLPRLPKRGHFLKRQRPG